MFHAKALEMYTQCYQSMAMMDEDQDLEVRPRSDKCGVTSADIHQGPYTMDLSTISRLFQGYFKAV